MGRKVKGIRRHGKGWEAYVRIEGVRYQQSFALNTDIEKMKAWRVEQKTKLQPVKYADILTPETRTLPPLGDGRCYVYVVRSGDAVKIGRAVNPLARVRELQTAHHVDLVLLVAVPADPAIELAFHKRLAHLRTRAGGEWFHLVPEVVAHIRFLKDGVNPEALLSTDPRVVLGWHLLPPPPVDDIPPCPES